MGGEVGVTSEPGNGSRFWFQVPVRSLALAQDSRGSERVPAEAAPASAANLLHGHVLVVEDNLINCMVIESLLRSLGVTVTVVHDGQQGIAAVTAHPDALAKPPQLVLMDLQMPVLDGYAATQHIRQWESTHQCPRLPIIALTADAFEEDRQRCLAVGMDDFLTKPIAIDALKSSLTKWLPFAPQTPAQAPAAVALKPVDQDAFAAVVHELTPLLEENKFAAISRFKALQSVVQGTALAEAIDALAPVLHQMRFDLALERLRHIALATQNTGEQP
jgi:CheY-like chemotaxis protein